METRRFALIIATNRYKDSGLSQLQAPVQDSETLAGILSNPEIGGFEVKELLNESSSKINQEIELFFKKRKRDDLLLLYFSGHGVKDVTGQLYFATTDTNRELLKTTAVPARLVNEIMGLSHSRRQVLILDCCYSGAFARGMRVRAGDDIGVGEYFKKGRGQVVLTASDAMQYAFEGDNIKGKEVRSVFTQALVDGLETGEADIDKDGYVSIDDLYNYVSEYVSNQIPEQEPRKWAFDVQGQIIIARNPRPIAKPLPKELIQAIESPYAGVREGGVHELDRLLRGNDKGFSFSAQQALEILKEDDSRKVSAAASKLLAAWNKPKTNRENRDKKEKSTPIKTETEAITNLKKKKENLKQKQINTGSPDKKPLKKTETKGTHVDKRITGVGLEALITKMSIVGLILINAFSPLFLFTIISIGTKNPNVSEYLPYVIVISVMVGFFGGTLIGKSHKHKANHLFFLGFMVWFIAITTCIWSILDIKNLSKSIGYAFYLGSVLPFYAFNSYQKDKSKLRT